MRGSALPTRASHGLASCRSCTTALFLLVLAQPALLLVSAHIPLQYKIPQRGSECLHEYLEKDESATASVFITSGAELKATGIFEGPVAPPGSDTAHDLKASIGRYGQGRRFGTGPAGQGDNILEYMAIDFETDANWDDDAVDDDDAAFDRADDDDEYDDDYVLDDDHPVAVERSEKRKQKINNRRAAIDAKRQKKVDKHQRASEGDALERTFGPIVAPGWYRLCVKSSWYPITVEMELRKASDLGGIDKRTGHVYTYQRRHMLEEEQEMEDLTPDGLQDEDMKTTHDQLKRLNRLLGEIKEYQQKEQHRNTVHAAVNEHSHSRMVLSSLLQTVIFCMVTGVQVYTVRKWFSETSLLGK